MNEIIILFTLILKITKLRNEPALSRNNNSRLASNINNNNKLAFEKNDGNNEFRFNGNKVEYIKKLKKSKSQK